MFAPSCRKFYKEQKLFHGHFVKMCRASSKVANFQHFEIFLSLESNQFARGWFGWLPV